MKRLSGDMNLLRKVRTHFRTVRWAVSGAILSFVSTSCLADDMYDVLAWYSTFDAIAIGSFVKHADSARPVTLGDGARYAPRDLVVQENLNGLEGLTRVQIWVALPPADWDENLKKVSSQANALYSLILQERDLADADRQTALGQFSRAIQENPVGALDRLWFALGGRLSALPSGLKTLNVVAKEKYEAEQLRIEMENEKRLATQPSRQVQYLAPDYASVGKHAATANAFLEKWSQLKQSNKEVGIEDGRLAVVLLQRDPASEKWLLQKKDMRSPVQPDDTPLIGKLRRQRDLGQQAVDRGRN